MSRARKQSDYEKTFAFRFFRWMGGEKDTFVGYMEMRPQKEYVEEEETIQERMRDRQQAMEEVYDSGHNKELRFFNVLYRCFSIVFCVAVVALLIITVSYLPSVGREDKPTNNIVSDTYISEGLTDTGAVNIVTGMILSYRAFDTFGETNVLFILYVAAFGFDRMEKFFNEKVYKCVKVTALICYGCIVTYYFLTGANGLPCLIPLGEPGTILSGGITLPINIFVGSEVACTMYAFYALFRRGGL